MLGIGSILTQKRKMSYTEQLAPDLAADKVVVFIFFKNPTTHTFLKCRFPMQESSRSDLAFPAANMVPC